MGISNIFDYHIELTEKVKEVLNTDDVKPGFQHIDELVEYEQIHSFTTGEAISAFARLSQLNISVSQYNKDKETVEKLVKKLNKEFTKDELYINCLSVSKAVSSMLDELGIWSCCYRGSIILEPKNQDYSGLFYLNDELNPPPNNSHARGHSWIFTPTHPVIDFTARHQGGELERIKNKIPRPVITSEEFFDPNLDKFYLDTKRSSSKDIMMKQYLLEETKKWPEWNIIHKQAIYQNKKITIMYTPMDSIFGAKKLSEEKFNLTIGGKEPYNFLEDFLNENPNLK